MPRTVRDVFLHTVSSNVGLLTCPWKETLDFQRCDLQSTALMLASTFTSSLEGRDGARLSPTRPSWAEIKGDHTHGPNAWRRVCWLVGCLTSQQHASISQGRICTANFTCCHTEMQIQLSISPSHSILTPGQPVPALTLQRQAPGRVASGVPMFKSLVWLDPGKIPEQAGFEPWIFRSWGGRLIH